MDLHVRFNRAYPQRNGHHKTLEDSRGLRAEVEVEAVRWAPPTGRLAPGAHCQPPCCNVGSPPPPRLHLRRPLSRFDPRAHVGRSGLYISAPAPLRMA